MAVVDLVLADPPSSVSLTTATTLLSLRSPSYSLFLSPPLPPRLPLSVSFVQKSILICLFFLFFFLLSFFFFLYSSPSPTPLPPLCLSLPLIASRSPFFFDTISSISTGI